MVRAMDFVLAGMVEATEGIGARLIVLYLPRMTLSEMGDDLPDQVKSLSIPEPAIFLNAAPALRRFMEEKGLEDLKLAAKDAHPSPQAHEIIADLLEREIRRQGLLNPLTQ